MLTQATSLIVYLLLTPAVVGTADVSTRVARLALLLEDQSVHVNTQTAEIKRLADIVDNKILPLIEQTAQRFNSSVTRDLNRKEHKLPNDTHDEMEKPDDKIPGGIEDGISSIPTDYSDLADCNKGWVQFNEICFGFSDEALDWFNAASACDLYGGSLVKIESETKQDWLVNQLRMRNFGETWIGGSKRYSGIWEWIPDFKSFTVSYWGEGEPNGPVIELCLSMYPDYNYKWNDRACTKPFQFVCEASVKAR